MIMVKWYSATLMVFLSLFVSFFTTANELESIKGAACIVRSGEQVVLVHESVTNKLSLPAGGVGAGENPADAAQRETWEEAGLVVTVKGELFRAADAVFYDCVSDAELLAYQHENSFGGHELPIWFAPHYGVEVTSAMLVDPTRVNSSEYRFPHQLKQIVDLLPNATDQKAVYLANLVAAAPPYNQIELNWILTAQQWLHSLPDGVVLIVERIVLMGHWLANPVLLLLLFPFVCWRFGKLFSYQVLFTLSVTSLLTLLAQQGFSLPRPQAYLPALGLVPSSGFNLPSLPVALWTSIGILLLHKNGKTPLSQWLSVAFTLALVWLSVAGFYAGSAFLIDSVSGAILGGLCAWHVIRLERKPDIALGQLMASKGVWFGLLVACTVMSVVWPTPTLAYWLAVLVTVFALVTTKVTDPLEVSLSQALLLCVMLFISNMAFDHALTLTSTHSLMSLLIEALRYPTLILLFVLPMRIKARLSQSAR